MRIRCTKGMRITNFYGNFFIRGTDLMALPNCNTESVFAFDLAHDEQNLTSNYVTIQAALLYTSSDGERRIRVMTQVLPVTSLTSEVMNTVNTDACTALLAKQAIEVALKSGLDNARLRLQQVCVEIIRAAKSGVAGKYDTAESGLLSLAAERSARGKASDAIEIIRFAGELHPKSYSSQLALGQALTKSGDQKAAVVAFKTSLALNPRVSVDEKNAAEAAEKAITALNLH